jgi:hypothetical protein
LASKGGTSDTQEPDWAKEGGAKSTTHTNIIVFAQGFIL